MQFRWNIRFEGRRKVIAVCLMVMGLQGVGCGSEDSSESSPPAKEERTQAVDIVDRFEANLREHLSREAVRRLVLIEIRDRLTEPKQREPRGLQSAGRGSSGDGGDGGALSKGNDLVPHARPPDASGLARLQIVQSLYERRGYRPYWVFRGGLGADLQRRLLQVFESSVRHDGLWPDSLHVGLLGEFLNEPGTRIATGTKVRRDLVEVPGSLSNREHASLVRRVAERLAGSEADGVDDAWLARIATRREDPPTPRLAEWLAQTVEQAPAAIQTRAEELAQRDLALTDATTHYAGVMRWDYKAWYRKDVFHQAWRRGETGPLRTGWPMNFEAGESPPDQIQSALDAARHRAALQGWVASNLAATRGGEDSIAERLQSLRPDYEPYRRLAEVFPAYRGIVQRGGWPEVPDSVRGLGPGSFAAGVSTLKQRLAVEGYYPDASSRGLFFGDDLSEAIRTYQSTHQLRRTGVVDPPTWRSLNVSAEYRFHQMRVTLQRWRESRATDDPHYLRVNIPGFHLAVWRGGERKMRFRVMVGQATKKENEKTGEVRWPHATPRFSDRMRYLVFNPFWNIPHNIRVNEIQPKLKENEKYLKEERIEKVTTPNGYTYLRQRPGPKNALGRVKFLFPNEMSIYLHDTPHHALFRRPYRALSHGCIRVESPMKLVDYLLDLDGRWDQKERIALMKDWFSKDSESWVRLEQPLPIHLEYYVVRADRSGRVHFFSDLYELNERRLEATDRRLASLPGDTDVPAPGDSAWVSAALRGDAPTMPPAPVQFDPASSSVPPRQLPKRSREMPEFLQKQTEKVLKKRKKQKKEKKKQKNQKKRKKKTSGATDEETQSVEQAGARRPPEATSSSSPVEDSVNVDDVPLPDPASLPEENDSDDEREGGDG